MAYYTRGGDKGQTKLIGQHRVSKSDKRVNTYGTIDEVNSFVGVLISYLEEEKKLFDDIIKECKEIQQDLFDCGSDIAQINNERPYKVKDSRSVWLESLIDEHHDKLPEIVYFIIPGGTTAGSMAHVARTTVRRAERELVELLEITDSSCDNFNVLKYLNRVSDYFFVIARAINYRKGKDDIDYKKSTPIFRNKKYKQMMREKRNK